MGYVWRLCKGYLQRRKRPEPMLLSDDQNTPGVDRVFSCCPSCLPLGDNEQSSRFEMILATCNVFSDRPPCVRRDPIVYRSRILNMASRGWFEREPFEDMPTNICVPSLIGCCSSRIRRHMHSFRRFLKYGACFGLYSRSGSASCWQ